MEIDSSVGGRNECILNVFEHHIFRTYVGKYFSSICCLKSNSSDDVGPSFFQPHWFALDGAELFEWPLGQL